MKELLQKYGEIKGLPVISCDEGEKIGILKDILLFADNREVAGFILSDGSYAGFARGKVLTAVLKKDVIKIGNGALFINNTNCVKRINKSDDIKTAEDLLNMKVYSKTGYNLGKIADILFDLELFKIEAVRVTDGLVQDVIYGKRLLPLIGDVEMGSECIIVEREATEEMENSGGGIKNKFFGEN